MNINDIPKIKDLSAKELRKIAKELSQGSYFYKERSDWVIEKCVPEKYSQADKDDIFAQFIEQKLIKSESMRPAAWQTTLKFNAIQGVLFTKRKNDDDAWLNVAKLIARIVVLAQSENYLIEHPAELYLFGSMLDKNKKNYGDADLALTTQRKYTYKDAVAKQTEWLKTYGGFVHRSCYGTYEFHDEYQLRTDLKSGNSFYSIHSKHELDTLNGLNEEFPVMRLWNNNMFNNNENDILKKPYDKMCEKWKTEHAESYNSAQEKLSNAFKKLNISKVDDETFIKSCEKHVKQSLKYHLIQTIKSGKRDDMPTSRAVRFGEIGTTAIKESFQELLHDTLGNSRIKIIPGAPKELNVVINAILSSKHPLTPSDLEHTKMHEFLSIKKQKFKNLPLPKF